MGPVIRISLLRAISGSGAVVLRAGTSPWWAKPMRPIEIIIGKAIPAVVIAWYLPASKINDT